MVYVVYVYVYGIWYMVRLGEHNDTTDLDKNQVCAPASIPREKCIDSG